MQKQTISITGFGADSKRTLGFVVTPVNIGGVRSRATFHVIEASTSYHLLVGRAWMHPNGIVPSTLHQCAKGVPNGMLVTIEPSSAPFSRDEAHHIDAAYYTDLSDAPLQPNRPDFYPIPLPGRPPLSRKSYQRREMPVEVTDSSPGPCLNQQHTPAKRKFEQPSATVGKSTRIALPNGQVKYHCGGTDL